jgi:surface antigen
MSMPIRASLYCTGRALAGIALVICVCPAFAANLEFLNDTPLSYMKQRDIDSAQRAVVEALNAKADGETAQWTNSGLGNSVAIDATITPDSTVKQDNQTCRTVAVVLNAKGQSLNLHPKYCRSGSGQWALQKRN